MSCLKLVNSVGLQLVKNHGFLAPINLQINSFRGRKTKHWNPKWKHLRRLKVMKVDLPDYHEKQDELSEEKMRTRLKEKGLLPPRPWNERQFVVHSTGGIFEPYVPPEGDGKISPITTQGAKQSLEYLSKKSKTMMAIRKIRQFDEDFDSPQFCKEATDIYIKMHECMVSGNKDGLIKYVTERAYPEVIHNLERKTIHWKYFKDIELPRIVHARCTNLVAKENVFAQVTVRFHTQQLLAIYDRFGRLMHGSEILAKDVLEYIVFEKHMANQYGSWRVHAKIIPDWMPPKQPSLTTFRNKILPPPEPETAVVETPEKTASSTSAAEQPAEKPVVT